MTLPTIVQAASSPGSRRGSGRLSPVCDQLPGVVGPAAIMGAEVAQGRLELGELPGVGASADGQPEHPREPVAVGGAGVGRRAVPGTGLAEHPLGQRREASIICGSFIRSRAWSGVLVRSRRTVHASRDGASKVVICGGAEVRFQKM